jgi:integrase
VRLTPRAPRVVVNYRVHESDTKTASGRRALALDPATLEALREHRQRQAAERAVAELVDGNDLVFTWPDGRALHPDLITDWFRRHAKRATWEQDGRQKVGLPAIRLHDVRHSYATAALAAGIPAKIVSERLGHANVQITLDTYSPRHSGPGRARRGDRRAAHPRGPGHYPEGRPKQRRCQFCCQNGERPPPQRGGEGRRPW